MLVSHQFYWKQDLYTADDVVLAQGVPVSLVCGLRVDDRMAAVVVPLELLRGFFLTAALCCTESLPVSPSDDLDDVAAPLPPKSEAQCLR